MIGLLGLITCTSGWLGLSSGVTTLQEALELLQLPGWLHDPDSGYGGGGLELWCIRWH